ncbi:CapA family protein [Natronorubrum sp. FCH18a]|uniref:CapA family protein n=1 Tax=Natronorubrum sp. FCH18a TaxID=3447018 RepID=UPI003F51976F
MAVHLPDELSLSATGDAILTREILPYEGYSEQFDNLLETLRNADATVTNLEVIVHDYDNYHAASSGGTYMRAPPAVLDELSAMGCNLFSAATNHVFDFTYGGIETTLDELDRRNLSAAGLGKTLYEARCPAYIETPAGRVGLVSACSSITPGSSAGPQSQTLPGRPGLNPLSVEPVYQITPSDLDQLRAISEVAGIEAMKRSWIERGIYYNHDWTDQDYFHFGDMKFRTVNDESETGLTYETSTEDRQAILEWIEAADRNADWVAMSLHTHQGVGGKQLTETTPEFVQSFARDCIDAGADLFIGTGPHVLRGIELYDDSPIFYSLGNFIVQNETVERLPPESFQRYDLGERQDVSAVFDARLYDDEGEPKGDLATDAFWETIVPECTFTKDGGLEHVELHPCTLQQRASRPQRGIPVRADGETAVDILETVMELSEPFGTDLRIEDTTAIFEMD